MDSKRNLFVVLAVVLVLAVAAFAVAGCGSTTTTTTAAPATTTTAAAPATTGGAAAGGASGTLVAKGLIDKPATWTVADLEKLNPVTITAEHPKTGSQEYTGVKLADLFKLLAVQAAAKTLAVAASDGFTAEVPLSDIAASADSMLAIGDDGKLNMVMPAMSSKSWVKDVTSWEFK
jgi:hypothetical protein